MRFAPHLNLVVAWVGILLGFLSGLILGLNFHREEWLGGYGSLKRRLYRLAHISFFGLGTVNLLFYLSSGAFTPGSTPVAVASWAFIVGAASMPGCCVLMAHSRRAQSLFAGPVLSLVLGAVLTVQVLVLPQKSSTDSARTRNSLSVRPGPNSLAVQKSGSPMNK